MTQPILDLFDSAARVEADVCLWEHRQPGATSALVAWAAARGIESHEVTAGRDQLDRYTSIVTTVYPRGRSGHTIYVYRRAP